MIEKFEEEDKMNKGWIKEHLEMAMKVEEATSSMELPVLSENTLKDLLKKLKNNKAAGPDQMKGEYFKVLGKDETCRKTMLKCYNNVLKEERAPALWNRSTTKMIKKVKRPTVRDFRPIALTNVSYKIYMAFIRDKIEEHLKRNHLVMDNQVGFTKGGRIEYNHFILQYIVEQIYKDEATEKKGKRKTKTKEKNNTSS